MDIKRTVLLADANEEFRAMLRSAIEKEGEFTVVDSVGDGIGALQSIEQKHPDLVVLDMVVMVILLVIGMVLVAEAAGTAVIQHQVIMVEEPEVVAI